MLEPQISRFGEKGILLTWMNHINDDIYQSVLAYQHWIEQEHQDLIQETNIGYQSVLIVLNNEIDASRLSSIIENMSISHLKSVETINYLYTIPVCYHTSFGLDISPLAANKNLKIQEVIDLHTDPIYKVYFTGFLPGFLYLGGLNKELHAPRLSKPRIEIPKGSVGIGGEQTGIYPQNSPGGWQIIGKTPLILFDKNKTQPTLCRSGDRIQFKSISVEAYASIESEVKSGAYQIRKEVVHD